MTTIQWVNHASLVIREGPISLICDPWIEGTAFDDGWALLSPTQFEYADFAGVTHIWFSHEHPDHFAPTNLRKIDPEIRKNIVVLFQKTVDQKVLEFCRSLDFRCQELEPGQYYQLSSDIRVMCRPFGTLDSWLLVEASEARILNLNDCPVRRSRDIEAIKNEVGDVDVLLTQFSYANWAGNRDDLQRRLREARLYMDQMLAQIRGIQPMTVIPFASYIYWCHEENELHNEGMNKITSVNHTILTDTPCQSVVMYPGDEWEIGTSWNSTKAIKRYEDDYEAVVKAPNISANPVSVDQLQKSAQNLREHLKKENLISLLVPLRFLGFLRPAKIFLEDLQHAQTFSMFDGLHPLKARRENCDIALSSASLLYCLDNLWGCGTLTVNGRYEEPILGQAKFFYRQFAIASENNQGRYWPKDIFWNYLRKNAGKLFTIP